MPIKFPCSKCNKTLQTPDDTAGQQAQCPNCGLVMTIPEQGTPPPFFGSSPMSPPPSSVPQGPPAPPPFNTSIGPPAPEVPRFMSEARTEELSRPASIDGKAPIDQNPYSASQVSSHAGLAAPIDSYLYQTAKQRLMGPGIGLIICSALGLLLVILHFIGNIVMFFEQQGKPWPHPEMNLTFNVVFEFVWLVANLVILFGAISLLKAKHYGFSMAACIMSMVPFLTLIPCCVFPYIFSIWGLVVLADPMVKSLFMSGSAVDTTASGI